LFGCKLCRWYSRTTGTKVAFDEVSELRRYQKKKFHVSWEKCLRAGFFTPVEGRRGRWAGQPPDWVRWADTPGPLRGHTTGLLWTRHGRSARAMTRGLEMRVPDGAGARSIASFGWESFAWVRCTWVRGWSIQLIRTKLDMTIFDEYANILKGMYSTRFNGRTDLGGTLARPDTGRSDHGESPARSVRGPTPPLINSLTVWQSNKIRKRKERGSKEKEI
jgi:hypothetical protein